MNIDATKAVKPKKKRKYDSEMEEREFYSCPWTFTSCK
jgi:hypothetical protein